METDAQARRATHVLLGLGLMAGVATITVLSERRYERWWAKNEPFVDTRVRVAKALNRAAAKYESAAEWAGILGSIALGVALARQSARTFPSPA